MGRKKAPPPPVEEPCPVQVADVAVAVACALIVVYARRQRADAEVTRASCFALLCMLVGVRLFVFLEAFGAVDSLYFVSCTLSSVGYGDIAPATPLGRVAVCGLCLVGMGAFGALTEAFGKWRAHAPWLAGGDGLLAATATLAALLTIGTPLFMYTEDLSADDAVYFTFITMTTVGYGDVSPQTPAGRVALSVFTVVALAPMAFVTTVFAGTFTDALKGPGAKPDLWIQGSTRIGAKDA